MVGKFRFQAQGLVHAACVEDCKFKCYPQSVKLSLLNGICVRGI